MNSIYVRLFFHLFLEIIPMVLLLLVMFTPTLKRDTKLSSMVVPKRMSYGTEESTDVYQYGLFKNTTPMEYQRNVITLISPVISDSSRTSTSSE
jgi:hypothetical protein